jgi:type VI secretion system protein ImpE
MNPKELIKAGRLSDARKQLTEEVKASPADTGKRTLLFQVLAFCGEWDRAERHLDAIASQDVKSEIGVQIYRNIMLAEKQRIEVSKLLRRPSILPKTPPYFELYVTALERLGQKNIEGAREVFEQIDAERPVVSGSIGDRNFSGFQDTDAFLSVFLEGVVHEQYVWIPLESIRELIIAEPKTLFDLLWIPAHITTWEGLSIGSYLHVLYPDSFSHQDERVKLGRMTDWVPLGGPFSKGVGQHVFQVGEEELAILEIQEVVFNPPAAVLGDYEKNN